MDNALYNTTIECPVCSKKFEVTKVRAKTSKVLERDSDFCVYYEGINPIMYDVWVCEHCGYAAQQDKFSEISDRDAKTIKETISPKWHQRSFAGERSIENSIEAFKIALLNLQVRKAKASELAKVCIRIAWLYRIAKDEKEKDFMKFALKGYTETFEKENFPVDKLDENTCLYMIGELNRRVGNLDDSIKWFSRLIGSPQGRQNPKLIEAAREQFQLAKEQLGDAAK
ncbi:MAG: DUF2225 domain-containing protein [Clostridia bacterium]|nr:DUF2225 domain-containing protein [Clostridia bacterium]